MEIANSAALLNVCACGSVLDGIYNGTMLHIGPRRLWGVYDGG